MIYLLFIIALSLFAHDSVEGETMEKVSYISYSITDTEFDEAGQPISRTIRFDLYEMNADGTDPTLLVKDIGMDNTFAWSSTGDKFAFHSHRDDFNICVMNRDGANKIQVTEDPQIDAGFSWSPNSEQIAFTSQRDGADNIFIINADGTNPVNVSNDSTVWDMAPNWSPNGDQFAFMSHRDERWDIYTMNIDGTQRRNITRSPASDRNPIWSPDGTQIAFLSNRDLLGGAPPPSDVYDIYVIQADGTNPINLTQNPSRIEHLRWSSDGEKIVFTANRNWNSFENGDKEIYMMDVKDREIVQLTDTSEASHGNTFPDWVPN